MPRLIFLAFLIVISAAPGSAQHDGAAGRSEAELRAGRLLVRGMTMLHTGDVASARASFEMALHLSPDNPSILAALADAHAAAGDHALAIQIGRRALEREPRDAQNAWNLARLLARDHDVDAGTEALSVHRRAAPGLAADLMLLRYLGANRRFAEAVDLGHRIHDERGFQPALLDALLDVEPSAAPGVDALIGEVVRSTGDPAVAMAVLFDPRLDLDASARLRDVLVSDFPALASAFRPAGRTPTESPVAEAPSSDPLTLLDRAMRNPRDLATWVNAARALLDDGRAGLALVAAREASMLFPGRDDLSAIRLRAAVALGDRSEGMAAARAALRHEASVDLAYAVAAWAHAEDEELGAEALEFVSSIISDDPVARLVGAMALSEVGAPARMSVRLLSINEREQSTSSELSGLRGLVALSAAEPKVAREWLERSVEIGNAMPIALEALADLRENAGDHVTPSELRALAAERRAITK